MALKIRLRRMGAKKRPFYRIVIANSQSPRDGRFVEVVGNYNPLIEPAVINVNEEKILSWLDKGAQPTEAVKSLLVSTGVLVKHQQQKKSNEKKAEKN